MRFYTESLLSKFGFGDGDMLNDLLFDSGISLDNEHDLLIKVVREHVLPAIKQQVVVYEIKTIHNPIRADSIDGVKVNVYQDNEHIKLEPEFVEVDDSVILKIARDFNYTVKSE